MRRARRVARQAARGLIEVVAAPDPAPIRSWRSPWRARAARTGLGLATLVCALLSLFGLTGLTNATGGGWFTLTASPGTVRQRIVARPVLNVSLPDVIRPGWLAFGGPAVWSVLLVLVALAVVVPLPLAARYPLLSWRIAWASTLLVPLAGIRWAAGGLWNPVQLPVLLITFCLAGIRHPRPVLWWMWALSLLPWWLYAGHLLHALAVGALGTVAFTVLAVAVDAVGTRRRLVAEQAERTDLEQARRAVLTERARIARELHDVVAHHLSLMAVRAETAPYRLADLPEPVREEFGSLSAAAREALADMRRLLGVLRDEGPAERAPQPQLADLPVLIDAARQAGVPVELSVVPGPAPTTAGPIAAGAVPAAVGVCAYRIVQESLSNASRHAQGAPVTVSLGRCADGVLLQVANGPGPAGVQAEEGSHRIGHGLTGMRERVALLGGSLTAGPSPDGGFVVSALLPVSAAP
jgi:signal transduction histidine kinase